MSSDAYGYLADLIVAFHLAYVGYVVIGLACILVGAVFGWRWTRNHKLRLLHLIMIMIVAVETVLHIDCPLTVWEENLRDAAKQKVDERSFVGRMLDYVLFMGRWETEQEATERRAETKAAKRRVAEIAAREAATKKDAPSPTPAKANAKPEGKAPAVFPTEPTPPVVDEAEPEPIELSAFYVGLAVFIGMLYMTYPPLYAPKK